MEAISNILPWIQIILSVLLATVILLQQSGAGLGGAFGGGADEMGGSHTKRGFEKILFNSTIIIAILFAVSALLSLV